MNSKHGVANRMCSGMMSLAAAALLAGGIAMAQTGTAPQQPMNGGTAGSGSTNGSMNGGTNGSMNGGTNGSMSSGSMQQSGMGTMPMGGSSAMGSAQDKKFAKKAMAGGMAEIQLGQLAQQKSNSDDVKKFGQQMVDDHTKLNDQMKPIAASIGVQPPMDVMPKDKALMTKLQGLSGDEFDKAYIKAMVKDHKEDDKEFQMEASSGQNQQEKDAAMQGDTVIKQHMQMVMDLAKTHNVMGGSGKSM